MDCATGSARPGVKAVLSVVVPVRDEAENIRSLLAALVGCVHVTEVVLVYDADDDPTIPAARALAPALPFAVRLVKNRLGAGPACAIRTGFAAAAGKAVVVMMADLCDDPASIGPMANLYEEGYDLVCASRYAHGGRHIGGPPLKRTLSRLAGLSLHRLAGIPTRDATNSFKLYDRRFLTDTRVESAHGFEVGIELTVKAWASGRRIAEVPTRWIDRQAGRSHFRLWRWLPHYVRWYLYAMATAASGRRTAPSPLSPRRTAHGRTEKPA